MMKTKQQWLFQLRKCGTLATLETVAERIEKRLTAEERPAFWLATDHRRAEITMKKLYDTIPANVWRYVK
ncbi:Modulating protein YmoA [Enterobacter cloacae]|jgi:hemolysin expression modulating protein|uniref:Hha protein n=7 Tax=Enterobacterales TaxID=91347 RepID=A0A384ZT63_ECOLX|nr:Hha protein [Klebsiella pneumoniae JM45]ALK43897.1 Hha protein [Enterobacter cloacae]AVA18247.1 Hemolysin activation protein [Citrobacter freundii]AXE42722.1 Hha protein [Citrobacter portucalensis]AXE42739.1 Hha protein [Escherichia coli]QIS31385.1 Hha protein (plasmid) [Serratia marcescens]